MSVYKRELSVEFYTVEVLSILVSFLLQSHSLHHWIHKTCKFWQEQWWLSSLWWELQDCQNKTDFRQCSWYCQSQTSHLQH